MATHKPPEHGRSASPSPKDGGELLARADRIMHLLCDPECEGRCKECPRTVVEDMRACLAAAERASREELAVACLRRLASCNIDNQTQRDLAGADIKSTLEKIDHLGAKPADDGRNSVVGECAKVCDRWIGSKQLHEHLAATDIKRAILALSSSGKTP